MSNIPQPVTPRGGIATWIALVGCLAVFVAALLYYLGRLYLTAYYDCFGIGPGALAFSTNDYMFSSVPVVFLVIGTIPGIVFAYFSLVRWMPFGISTELNGKKRGIAIATGVIWQLLFALVIYNFFTLLVPINFPYLDSFTVGIAIGALFPTVLWLFMIVFVERVSLKVSPTTVAPYFYMLAVVLVYFFATMPVFVDRMAERFAYFDANRLASVTIVTRQSIPELQTSQTGIDNQINAKLLVINNSWIYFFGSSDSQNSQTDALRGLGPLYSIQISDIERIVYQASPK
jgi:hypothetical protein